jgi:chromosomal replication initiator protein
VCNFFKTPKNEIVGKKKNKEFVLPRQVSCYLICEMMNLPLDTIGKIMGGRDHTTVIYARDKISALIKQDVQLSVAVNDIKKMLLKQ